MNQQVGQNEGLGLIVPVDLVAYCVGAVDAHQATVAFAGANTVYTDQTGEQDAFLGANVTRDFSDAPWQPMEQGVHLHWALPDALTRANTTSGNLAFQAVPNRWLVTRYLIDGKGTPQIKSWVVLSDLLSSSVPSGQRAVTLPVKTTDNADYRFVGNYQKFDQNWREPKIPTTDSIQSLTGSELTAVASGVVSFAAFYPNCRSVFGFYDQLQDVPTPGSAPVNLMYVVTGWFANPANDPLHGGSSLPELQKSHQWTFSNAAAQPEYSLYQGQVQDVAWNPGTNYIYQQPSQQPVPATIAIGNSSAEALSAYFGNRNHPGVPFFEQLLTAFQLGVLESFKQPQPDQMAQLESTLHQKEFAALQGGSIYTILKQGKAATDESTEAIDLPLKLAHDLNLLNQSQQQADQCQARMASYRWQLFADWYRIFEADSKTKNTAFHVAYEKYGNWSALQSECQKINAALSGQLAVVNAQLGEDLELKQTPAAR